MYIKEGAFLLQEKIFKFDIPQNPRHKLKNDNLLLLYTSVDEQRNMENMIYAKGIFIWYTKII